MEMVNTLIAVALLALMLFAMIGVGVAFYALGGWILVWYFLAQGEFAKAGYAAAAWLFCIWWYSKSNPTGGQDREIPGSPD